MLLTHQGEVLGHAAGVDSFAEQEGHVKAGSQETSRSPQAQGGGRRQRGRLRPVRGHQAPLWRRQQLCLRDQQLFHQHHCQQCNQQQQQRQRKHLQQRSCQVFRKTPRTHPWTGPLNLFQIPIDWFGWYIEWLDLFVCLYG